MFSTSLINGFITKAVEDKVSSLATGYTWNGDINYASLGHDFESALLELDQKMVLPEKSKKTKKLPDDVICILNRHFNKIISTVSSKDMGQKAKAYSLLFRYMFYLRSIRVAGKRQKLMFYYLFDKMYSRFPKSCVGLLELIPDFGYFKDLDYFMTKYKDDKVILDKCLEIYISYLNSDCSLIFGKTIDTVSFNEAKELNTLLTTMSVDDIKKFVNNKRLSLASKWLAREGKKNSEYRRQFLSTIYNLDFSDKEKGEKRFKYTSMRFRHVITTLSRCISVVEQIMCDNKWATIDFARVPACAMTKYRKAFANEKLKEVFEEHHHETGNRYPDNEDRVHCRKNLMTALFDDKLKGAMQDIDKLSKIIFEHVSQRRISPLLSSVERAVLSKQWNDIVSSIKTEIDEILSKTDSHINPKNVIPVIDTSGSMVLANVKDKAIGLGILASMISTLPGCLISFSDKPHVFHLDFSEGNDVFDHFIEIVNGPIGYSTNVDATYRLLLDIMTKNNVKATDFALLFLTDSQFNSLCQFEGSRHHPDEYFEKTFLNRIEKAFTDKGYNLPRTIFWNLNCRSPGFPATTISRGVQLVSGYSQSLMIQVMTGNYEYELQDDGTFKVSVDPWTSFFNSIMHQGYDIVVNKLAQIGEAGFVTLNNLESAKDVELFFMGSRFYYSK